MTASTRQAVSPAEARGFGTDELRGNFLIEDLFADGEIRMTYSHLDRMVLGGVVAGGARLPLGSPKEIGSDTFLARREMGVFCISGSGTVEADGQSFAMSPTDCLYLPMGTGAVAFAAADGAAPARFYFVSLPAHRRLETRKVTAAEAEGNELGAQADANRRVLRKYIHPGGCPSCQLVMGMTELAEGSVWNTMPCHTHDRRSESYLYFDMAPQTRVFHIMGEPRETRHMVVANEQAILSPGWSVHCGSGTARYSFIWAMGGDNQRFDDMDMVAMEDLR